MSSGPSARDVLAVTVSKSMKLKVLGLVTRTHARPGTYDVSPVDYGSHPMPIHSRLWCYHSFLFSFFSRHKSSAKYVSGDIDTYGSQ
jgi:hypothetical protein